jgi:8-oxo-dGTP pyrophosphatase MutT (NUDIX family)
VKYADAVARLAVVPTGLPPPAEALRPTRLAAGGGLHPSETAPAPDATRAGRAAAVLVLIVPGEDGEARVILTQRADRGGRHSGEVSFPGGETEPGDADAVATAVREAAEEVGLDTAAAGVRIVGTFDPFHINVSGYAVTPVLAIAERRPELVAAPDEVARILEAPIRHFLPGAPIEVLERQVQDWTLRYGAYRVEELEVWGATARILSQLGALLGA